MVIDPFQEMVRAGKLRRQKAGFVQVEALLREALLDLQEARLIRKIAQRATYLLAYTAMLKAGRALLLLRGYVPDDGAQHRTVVEMTGHILGERFVELTDRFERMRRKRNDMTYGTGVLLSGSESRSAFQEAVTLVSETLEVVRNENPQLTLRFDPGKEEP